MPHLPPLDLDHVRRIVREALEEDGAFRDVTTRVLVPPDQQGYGVFLAREQGVLAGLPVSDATFKAFDPEIRFRGRMQEGQIFAKGDILAEVEGPLASILSAERVALNYLQRLCGIATGTRSMVNTVADLPARVVDTRKTTPGLRLLERYAVSAGGGHNHRFNLADGILIKDNHIAAARQRDLSITDVVRTARAHAPHTLRIEIEVTSFDEAQQALQAGADIILLDNMTPEEMARVVQAAQGRALFEASGGVTLANVRAIAEAGVDIISSGALTHSAPSIDISLEIEARGA